METQSYFDTISSSLDFIIKNDTNVMISLNEELQKDERIIDLYTKNQKEDLYAYTLPILKKLCERHKITHFYFHTLEGYNYLRVHRKEEYGDKIDRITLKESMTKKKVSYGVEFGIMSNLTLHVVSPWRVNGKVIGYIELGKEVNKITKEFTNSNNVDILFTIKRSLIKEEDYLTWIGKNHRNRSYHKMDRFYVIDSTIKKIDDELQQCLNHNGKCAFEVVENDGKKYLIEGKEYYDITLTEVGKIFILKDVTQKFIFLYEISLKITFIVFVLLGLLILYYVRHILKIEGSLNESYTKMQELSHRDGLTGLYNKGFYLTKLEDIYSNLARFNVYMSYILVDVDNFKKYNDHYGHLKGDDVLVSIGSVLQTLFKRNTDYAFRIGGEEFLIVSASSKDEDAEVMAMKLASEIERLNIPPRFK